MDEYDPRELLKALQERTRERCAYEWRVHIHMPVEDVLDMVQNRYNAEWQAKRKNQPYTVTANFETLEEAEHYAYMVRLTGRRCSINNNWTGAVYQDEE